MRKLFSAQHIGHTQYSDQALHSRPFSEEQRDSRGKSSASRNSISLPGFCPRLGHLSPRTHAIWSRAGRWSRKSSGPSEPQFQPSLSRDPVESWPVHLEEGPWEPQLGGHRGQGLNRRAGYCHSCSVCGRAGKQWLRGESTFQCSVCVDQANLSSFRITGSGDPFEPEIGCLSYDLRKEFFLVNRGDSLSKWLVLGFSS